MPYEKREDAQKEVDGFNPFLGFCPQIGDDCTKYCVCYVVARVVERNHSGKNKYYAYGPYCSHVLISGVISVE